MQEAMDILHLFKNDEHRAVKLLFETYYDKLVLYSYCLLKDMEAAEDVVQDCFLYLWSSKRLNGFVGELEPFLFKIVKNQTLLSLKAVQKRCSLQESLGDIAGEDFDVDVDDERAKIDLLYATIDRLAPKTQRVFLMACLYNKTYQEIADELGISINTVKWHMKSAIRFLRENLESKLFLSFLFLLTNK